MLNPKIIYDEKMRASKFEIGRINLEYAQDCERVNQEMQADIAYVTELAPVERQDLKEKIRQVQQDWTIATQGTVDAQQMITARNHFEPQIKDLRDQLAAMESALIKEVARIKKEAAAKLQQLHRDRMKKLEEVESFRKRAYAVYVSDLETYNKVQEGGEV